MGTLKDRMNADMTRYGLQPVTRRQYLRHVESYARHFSRSPAELRAADIEAYFAHLAQEGRPRYFQQQVVNALKFFYFVTVERPEVVAHIVPPKKQGTIPDHLSPDDLDRLLLQIVSPLHRTILTVAMGGGLRLGEACRLESGDIDSAKMLIRVRSTKVAWPRFIPLHEETLSTLRAWWRSARPSTSRLFTLEPSGKAMTPGPVQQAWRDAAVDCGLACALNESVLRYSFFRHRLFHGSHPREVMHLLRCIAIHPVPDHLPVHTTDHSVCAADAEKGVRI